MKSLWRSLPIEHVVWTEWDGEYVLYHRPSGTTHFLNPASIVLLSDVLDHQKEFETVVRHLAGALGVDADEGFAKHVEALLYRLEELGLIERVETN